MTAKGVKQNPITVELRRKKLMGQKRSWETRQRIAYVKKQQWADGVYDHLKTAQSR